jgi:uncharacterized tellurite resistance protein B-like protein
MEEPVGDAEGSRLVAELNNILRTKEEKAFAISSLEEVVRADGVVSPAEQAVLDDMSTAIELVSEGLFTQLSKLARGAIRKRSEVMVDAPNRESYFEEYLTNKVYYEVLRRQDLGDIELNIDDADLRKLSAADGLKAKVARVDREVSDSEYDKMKDLLEDGCRAEAAEAAFVAEVAISEATPELDLVRLTREFVSRTSASERARFLDVRFSVADADGFVTDQEIEEMHKIATSLLLSSYSVHDAQLKIPVDRRAS